MRMNESLGKLMEDYCEALESVRTLKKAAQKRPGAGNMDMAALRSMERDLEWVIEYMETGYMPVYGRNRYKKKHRVSFPGRMPGHEKTILGKFEGRQEAVLLNKLRSALKDLSPREREIVLWVKGGGMSYREAAEYMHIRRSTVRTCAKRAFDKLANAIML